MRYVESYMHHNRIGVLIELETPDPITTRCKEFTDLAHVLAMQVAASDPMGIDKKSMVNVVPIKFRNDQTDLSGEALLSQDWIKDPRMKVYEVIEQVASLLKTPIRVTRFVRYSVDDT